jgi:MFS family permease
LCDQINQKLIGGVLGDSDWRWIFWINVPIGGVAWLASLLWVHDAPLPKPVVAPTPSHANGANGQIEGAPHVTTSKWAHFRHKMIGFDGIGVFTSAVCLLFFVMCMTTLVLPDKSLAATGALVGMSLACILCGLFFIAWQWKGAKLPIMPLSIYNDRTFSVAIFTSICMGFARGNITNLLIFFLQGPYGKDPLEAGVLMIPLGAGIMVGGIVSGKLTDVIGVRGLSIIGCTIATACIIGLGFVTRDTAYGSIAACITIMGLGFGLFNSPNAFAGFITVKPLQRGVASGIRMMSSMVSAMIAIIMVFVYILKALSLDQLLDLFVYATPLPPDGLGPFMDAVQDICWMYVFHTTRHHC